LVDTLVENHDNKICIDNPANKIKICNHFFTKNGRKTRWRINGRAGVKVSLEEL